MSLMFDVQYKMSLNFSFRRVNFMTQQKPNRQSHLMKEFGFKCECEACNDNYPTPPALKFKDVKVLKIAKKFDDEVLEMETNQAMKKFYTCCDILEKSHQNFPSLELCLLQKCLATCLMKQSQPSILF